MNDSYFIWLRFEAQRIWQMPLMSIASKTIIKLSSVVLSITILPITIIAHLLGYRYVNIFTDRIGHLALEPDCLLREQTLGCLPKRRWIIAAPPGRIANEHLLTYWTPHFLIIRSSLGYFFITSMARFGFMRHDVSHYSRAIGKAQASFSVYTKWGNKPPILKLNLEDENWLMAMLSKLGLPEQAWFVCVHAREGGYSPIDERLQNHRNSDIYNSIPAIQEITRRGGWVIRMGDSTMKPLPIMKNVVDYAQSPIKSGRMDLLLCAKARFFLGNTSGIALVSTIFGVPCAISNSIPTGVLWYNSFDISIPKLIRDQSSCRILNFDQIFESDISTYQYLSQYKAKGLLPEENSAEDIHALATEMLERLDGKFHETIEDKKQLSRMKQFITPRHYSFGTRANFSLTFLKKHPELSQHSEIN